MKVSWKFEPRDFWVGVFWTIHEDVSWIGDPPGSKKLVIAICLLPTLLIRLEFRWPFRGRSAYARESDLGRSFIDGGQRALEARRGVATHEKIRRDFQIKSRPDGPALEIESGPPAYLKHLERCGHLKLPPGPHDHVFDMGQCTICLITLLGLEKSQREAGGP